MMEEEQRQKKIITSLQNSYYLNDYQLYNWKPSINRSLDENYMDIVLLLTRNSHCRQGSMGAILVQNDRNKGMVQLPKWKKDNDDGNDDDIDIDIDIDNERLRKGYDEQFYSSIIGAGINSSFYDSKPKAAQAQSQSQSQSQSHTQSQSQSQRSKCNNSDIHAEINALGSASKSGQSTQDAFIYITMPPCKKCFCSLVASGIKRIITSKPCICKTIVDAAKHLDIELVHWQVEDEQSVRINKLVMGSYGDNDNDNDNDNDDNNVERTNEELMMIIERRKRKRDEKRERREKAILRSKNNQMNK